MSKKIFLQNYKYLPVIILPLLWFNFVRNKITLEIQSNKTEAIQIFYNDEKDEYTRMGINDDTIIQKTDPDKYQKYDIYLPYNKKINKIRIKFVSDTSDLYIKPIIFHSFFKKDPSQHITNTNNFEITEQDKKIFRYKSTANDHYLDIANIPPLTFPLEAKIAITILFTTFIIILVNLFKKFVVYKENEKDISSKIFVPIIVAIFVWFAYQTSFFATHIKTGIFPDEQEHYDQVLLYSKSSREDFKIGLAEYKANPINKLSPVYYFSIGTVLALTKTYFPNLNTLSFLRNLSIIFSLINLFFAYLLVKEITKNKLIQLSVLLMQTNILMFVFISSAVSYDNIINLLSTLSILFLIKIIKKPKILPFIFLLISLVITNILGIVIKKTFIPLTIIEIIIFLIYLFTALKNKIVIFLSILSLIFIFIFNYDTISFVYNCFQKNINTYQINSKPMDFKNFTTNYFEATEQRTFGILAHQQMFKTNLIGHNLLFVASFLLMLLGIKYIFTNKNFVTVSLISISYIIVQFIYNYTQSYLAGNIFGSGLQGRYNFPVITGFLILLNYSLLSRFNNKIKFIVILIISIFFIKNSFLWFLSQVTPIWYF